MSVVLMYHALYRDGNLGAIDVEDRPYAVSESAFRAQLDTLSGRGEGSEPGGCMAGGSPRVHSVGSGPRVHSVGSGPRADGSWPDVVLTFDDGHVSNHEIALPLLQAYGFTAIFFITSGFVDRRAHFCSRTQIAELAACGMRIGSHGSTHRFFDDLDPHSAADELSQSRDALETWSGDTVDSLSFPGGRHSRLTATLARRAGLNELYGSRFGLLRQAAARRPQSVVHNRVAIRRSTTEQEFSCIIEADTGYYRRGRRNHQLKAGLRSVLGNSLYHRIYQTLAER